MTVDQIYQERRKVATRVESSNGERLGVKKVNNFPRDIHKYIVNPTLDG